jgi:predicted CopG family antitoxin
VGLLKKAKPNKYACAYTMHMVKVISLSESAYSRLLSKKKKDMSFSDVVISEISAGDADKDEGVDDLLAWVKTQPREKKKVLWSSQIDKIAYGADS